MPLNVYTKINLRQRNQFPMNKQELANIVYKALNYLSIQSQYMNEQLFVECTRREAHGKGTSMVLEDYYYRLKMDLSKILSHGKRYFALCMHDPQNAIKEIYFIPAAHEAQEFINALREICYRLHELSQKHDGNIMKNTHATEKDSSSEIGATFSFHGDAMDRFECIKWSSSAVYFGAHSMFIDNIILDMKFLEQFKQAYAVRETEVEVQELYNKFVLQCATPVNFTTNVAFDAIQYKLQMDEIDTADILLESVSEDDGENSTAEEADNEVRFGVVNANELLKTYEGVTFQQLHNILFHAVRSYLMFGEAPRFGAPQKQ